MILPPAANSFGWLELSQYGIYVPIATTYAPSESTHVSKAAWREKRREGKKWKGNKGERKKRKVNAESTFF